MRILLTGGSGFLGSALAKYLQNQGHEVSLLLRPASNLARLSGSRFLSGRCSSEREVQGFVESVDPEAIIHTACSYGRRGETLLQLTDANLRLGLQLLQALQSLSARDVPRLFLNTGTALPAEINPYALSKRQFSQWGRLQALAAPETLQFVNIELEHMYGPGDDRSKFTSHVILSCLRNEEQLKLTAGEQRRDFIYIEDVLSGYATILRCADRLASYADVPLGSGAVVRIRDFVSAVHRLCGSTTALQFGALPYRAGEPMLCRADLALMREMGWRPSWSLEQGLEQTINEELSKN